MPHLTALMPARTAVAVHSLQAMPEGANSAWLQAGRGVGVGAEGSIKAREALLLPVYRQVAVAFAEMHDTPVRMVAKGVLRGIVPWPQARPFMVARLRRRWASACRPLLLWSA